MTFFIGYLDKRFKQDRNIARQELPQRCRGRLGKRGVIIIKLEP